MQRLSDLIALWSALAAAARSPGRVRILAAEEGITPGFVQHPAMTVVVALQGSVRIEGPSQGVDLLPGEAVVIAPGAAHRHAPLRRQAASLALGFEYGWCDVEFHTPNATVEVSMPRQPAEGLVARMRTDDVGALTGLLALLLDRPLQEARQLPEAARRMRDRIRSHGLTAITAADIARAGGLKSSRAWQVFLAHFGCTPHQALEQRRCAMAASFLDQGMSVAETARRCGFRHPGTFTRSFARIHGCTPASRRRTASIDPTRIHP